MGEFIKSIIDVFKNEHGEVVVEDSELSKEELAIIDGEEAVKPDEEPDPDPDKGETGETHKPDKDNLISQADFDKRTGEIRTKAEERLTLFRRDPEEFYKEFPDERPKEPPAPLDWDKLNVTGGQYHGKTLKEVYDVDPEAARALDASFTQAEREETERTEQEGLDKANAEIAEFGAGIAQDLFGKTDLTESERAKVDAEVQTTLSWMKEHKRGGGVMIDGYYLMHRETDQSLARGEGAEALIKSVETGVVRRITSSVDAGELSGYESDMAMSADQLSDKIDGMTDAAMMSYLADAPDDMKKKYPDLPWP